MEISSDFNFTVASWFLENFHIKPISTHSGGGEQFTYATVPVRGLVLVKTIQIVNISRKFF
jgi:hypothetical protein